MRKQILLLLTITILGCAPSYKFTLLPQEATINKSDLKLGVAGIKLIDVRKPYCESRKQGTICRNSEKYYQHDSIPYQITDILSKQLVNAGIFASTIQDPLKQCDYSLSANITKVYGTQEISVVKQVGQQFGLIGALATADNKTAARITIEFTDIELKSLSTNKVLLKIPSFERTYSEDMPSDANGWSIFPNVNTKMNSFIIDLVREMQDRIINPDKFSSGNPENSKLKQSQIILMDSSIVKGYIKEINDKHVVYFKKMGDPFIMLIKKYVNYIVTENDTIYSR
jgi:hypothetical protein